MRKRLGVFLIACFSCSYAAQVSMVNATMNVRNLAKILTSMKAQSSTPVVFPASIPAPSPSVVYYASQNLNLPNKTIKYIISVDSSPQCNGASYCNVGAVMAQSAVAPKVDPKLGTQSVTLANDLVGFYTPGHAEGDYFPAKLQWLDNTVLYTLIWRMPAGLTQAQEQQTFIQMANSAFGNNS